MRIFGPRGKRRLKPSSRPATFRPAWSCFATGDQSQMDVIKRWIDESDVFLLILGGRYGSIEPTTGKSYIQLEYEYAVEKQKALFAVVITDDHLESRVKTVGSSAIEKEQPQLLKAFRDAVLRRLVKFWSDPRDIKLAVLETNGRVRAPDRVGGMDSWKSDGRQRHARSADGRPGQGKHRAKGAVGRAGHSSKRRDAGTGSHASTRFTPTFRKTDAQFRVL